MKPEKVDRFVAKRKEVEANLTSTEDARLLALAGFKKGNITGEVMNIMTNASEGSMKQRGKTEELLKAENMELNTFCVSMIGLFRTIQENRKEKIVRENQDQLSHMVNRHTKETSSTVNCNISENKKKQIPTA
jgi:hypothetical protein